MDGEAGGGRGGGREGGRGGSNAAGVSSAKRMFIAKKRANCFECMVALISGGISRLINENRNRRSFIILAN